MTIDFLTKVTEGNRIFMTEIEETNYITSVTGLLRDLIEDGYTGVYVSFQRPYPDLDRRFMEEGISDDAVHIIDAATMLERDQIPEGDDGVTYLPEDETIDELARTIYSSVENTENGKKFILIDSLTTITLYQPLSETMRLAEFLIKTIDIDDDETILIFNVARGQQNREFVKDIAFQVDEVIALDE